MVVFYQEIKKAKQRKPQKGNGIKLCSFNIISKEKIANYTKKNGENIAVFFEERHYAFENTDLKNT